MTDDYHGLTAVDELELRRRREAEKQRALNDKMNTLLRAAVVPEKRHPGSVRYEKDPLAEAMRARDKLRRRRSRVSKSGVARTMDPPVDRGTLDDWIRAGFVPWPLPEHHS